MTFQRGDKVIVNRGLLATIDVYDVESNLVTYHHEADGGVNTVYAHISNTDIEPLVDLAAKHEAKDDEAEDGDG